MKISKEEGGIARVQGFVVFVENAKAGNKLG
jgi:predicted RNA-binding protein with TRAM domain